MTAPTLDRPPAASANRVGRADAARLLGVTVRTVDRYVHEGHLDRHRNPITGRPEYDLDQVHRVRATRQRTT